MNFKKCHLTAPFKKGGGLLQKIINEFESSFCGALSKKKKHMGNINPRKPHHGVHEGGKTPADFEPGESRALLAKSSANHAKRFDSQSTLGLGALRMLHPTPRVTAEGSRSEKKNNHSPACSH